MDQRQYTRGALAFFCFRPTPARCLAQGAAAFLVFFILSMGLILKLSDANANQAFAYQHSSIRLPGHMLSAIGKSRRTQSPSGAGDNQPIMLTLVLKHDREKAFERYLHDIYDPHSHNYRHFLTQSEIAERFGPSRKSYDAILAYVESYGFTLLEGSRNRMTITIGGTRGEAERGFQTNIHDYRLGNHAFYANEQNPSVPASLAGVIQGIIGLNNLSTPTPSVSLAYALQQLFGSTSWQLQFYQQLVQPTSTTFADAFAAIQGELVEDAATDTVVIAGTEDILEAAPILGGGGRRSPRRSPSSPALLVSVPAGSGQKIGIVSFSGVQLTDVAGWLTLANLPSSMLNQVSMVDVIANDSATLIPGDPGEGDVLAGIAEMLFIAPGAQITVYDLPSTGSAADLEAVFNKMLNDGVNVISNSFIYCEDQTTQADVNSIDAILASGAASGVSAFSATGDYGSSCSDGSHNTVAVPADSPHVTAVGASSLTLGPGRSYMGETWLDESSNIPPGAQSGFGQSTFFPRPSYQTGLLATPMRSVPDVVAPGDTAHGPAICEADAGGCLSNLVFGGTSVTTSMWAGFAAVFNQAAGQPLGFLNPMLYQLAGSPNFHPAGSMSPATDAEHVGLGTPNVDLLKLALTNQTPGAPDASISSVTTAASNPYSPFVGNVPADGSTAGAVIVQLLDSNGNMISGKTVSLSAGAGHASISPPSAVTSAINGTAIFTVTDDIPEDVTFSATTSDGLAVLQQPVIHFLAPPATSSLVSENPSSSLPADGSTAAIITVTLTDSLGQPTPGKLVSLSQGGGHSVIAGANPGVTDSSGQVVFSATDQVTEMVDYVATDVSDFSLNAGNVAVMYTTASGSGCSLNVLESAPGSQFTYTNYAWGFPVTSPNCLNPAGMAFDSSGNLYISEYDGNQTSGLYKIPPGGGSVSGLRLNATAYVNLTNASGLAFSKDGTQLYMARQNPTGANGDSGDVVQVSTTDGSTIRTIAKLDCATGLATDPISGDLFSDSPCGSPTAGPYIFRISNPESATPGAPMQYAPASGAQTLWFTPGGTLYAVVTNPNDNNRWIATFAGTNTAGPGAVTYVAPAPGNFGAVPDASNQDSPSFIFTDETEGTSGGLDIGGYDAVDVTQNTPKAFNILSNGSTNIYMIIGPDGCYYATQTDRVVRIAAADGSCNFTAPNILTRLTLSPAAVTLPLGSSQVLTATFQNPIPPAGTPVKLTIAGNNPQSRLAQTDASGVATFTDLGTFPGSDFAVASATLNAGRVASNLSQVNWENGQDTSFLSLNQSPKSGKSGQQVTVLASLSDISQNPATSVIGRTINFTLGNGACSGSTDTNGIASCAITLSGSGLETLSANFAGDNSLVASSAHTGFMVVNSSSCTGPLIKASLLSGNPNPPAGSSGDWTFQIAICPSQSISNVSAQGGTDNWTTVTSLSKSAGSLSVRKINKNDEILTWSLGSLNASAGQTLNVSLAGKVSAHCGVVQYLNGPWSMLYRLNGTKTQSPYTSQVAITSTCK